MCSAIRCDEVNSFNRKLLKIMKLHNHVRVCLMNSNRDYFTTHGLHMNARGKNWLADTWASIIKSLWSTSPPTTAIPLPDQSINPSNGNDVTNNLSHTDPAIFQVRDLNLTSNNSTNGNQRTARLKKPVDKKDDFLWYWIILLMIIPIYPNLIIAINMNHS